MARKSGKGQYRLNPMLTGQNVQQVAVEGMCGGSIVTSAGEDCSVLLRT